MIKTIKQVLLLYTTKQPKQFLNRNRLVNNYWLATNTDGWFMCTQ